MSLHGGMSESDWEEIALDTLGELAWQPKQGKDIASGTGEREKWEDLRIPTRMLAAMRRLNSQVREQYPQQALAEFVTPRSNVAITANERLHAAVVVGYRGIGRALQVVGATNHEDDLTRPATEFAGDGARTDHGRALRRADCRVRWSRSARFVARRAASA